MPTRASTDMETAYPFNLSSAPLRRLLFLLVCFCSTAVALESMPPGLYEVTTETGMPHMEESMRSGITREKRCLHHQELSSAFPILSHAALKGCKLDMEDRHENTVSYLLICDSKQGTMGKAQWQLSAEIIRGRLDVRLGGKNMTFNQRITAKPLGPCPSEKN